MDLLDRLQKIHPYYIFNPVQIANATVKSEYIDIVCPIHGVYSSTIKNLLKGRGCRQCANASRGLKKRERAKNNFFLKAPIVHHYKYDYSQVNYSFIKTLVTIICPIHGAFSQSPEVHLAGSGCPACGKLLSAKKRVQTRDNFIQRARAVHGSKYDYGEFTKISEKCTIICPQHGPFRQTPSSHLQGSGCPKCANEVVSRKLSMGFKEFVKRANHKFGNTFVYEKLNKSNVYVTCKLHGRQVQSKIAHLRSVVGCKECFVYPLKYDTKGFVKEAQAIHPEYDYHLAKYKGQNDNVTIICKKHGPFEQLPYNHISLQCGCPKCATTVSKPHSVILEMLADEEVEINTRDIIPPYELDIYLPRHKLSIEVNGIWFHSSKFKQDHRYHDRKFELCQKKKIKLLQYWDDDIKKHPDIVKSMIYANIGKSERIYARKCVMNDIPVQVYEDFLKKSHIQGAVHSAIKRGLFYNNELVAVMGLTSIKGVLNLQRFCNKLGTVVVGGFSKLLKPFTNEKVISFSDNFYSSGNVYLKNGFLLARENGPKLYYTKGASLINRRHFQKPVLKIKYPELDMTKTEKELAEELGYYQVFGGGTRKWVL